MNHRWPPLVPLIASLLTWIAIGSLAFLLVGCGTCPPVARDPVPSAVESKRLGEIEAAGKLTAAESLATAERLDQQLSKITEPIQRAKLQAQADAARLSAAIAESRSKAAADLRRESDSRAKSEQAELDRRETERTKAAAAQAARDRENGLRFWAILALAGCVVAGIALRHIGLPASLSLGIPGAVAGGAAFLIAYTSVPWIGMILGLALASAIIFVLAILLRFSIAEWVRYADQLAVIPDAKQAADDLSVARQSPMVRWLFDHLFASQKKG